jgi:hypothetical protein
VNSTTTDMRNATATVGAVARPWSSHVAFGTHATALASAKLPSAYVGTDVKGIRHRPSGAST